MPAPAYSGEAPSGCGGGTILLFAAGHDDQRAIRQWPLEGQRHICRRSQPGLDLVLLSQDRGRLSGAL